MAREKPNLIQREREYQIEQLALAMALRGAPRTRGNAHLWAPQSCWGGRTWVEWIIEQHGHLAADLVNRGVKRGEQQRMFEEEDAA